MSSTQGVKIQSTEHFLRHFSGIKHRRFGNNRVQFQIAPQNRDLSDLPNPILVTVDVDSSTDNQTVLTMNYSDNTTKQVTINDLTSRVEAIESNLTQLVQSQVDAANAVLAQFTNVTQRVAEIEKVV